MINFDRDGHYDGMWPTVNISVYMRGTFDFLRLCENSQKGTPLNLFYTVQKQESPPAWTQEAYRLLRIKYSLSCTIPGWGTPHQDWCTPDGRDLGLVTGVPPPSGKDMGPVEVLWDEDWVPVPGVNWQTNWNYYLPHPSDTGGKNGDFQGTCKRSRKHILLCSAERVMGFGLLMNATYFYNCNCQNLLICLFTLHNKDIKYMRGQSNITHIYSKKKSFLLKRRRSFTRS